MHRRLAGGPRLRAGRAARLGNGSCALTVAEAKDGEQIVLGHAYVAPGNHHLRIVRSGARYVCKVTQDPAIGLRGCPPG